MPIPLRDSSPIQISERSRRELIEFVQWSLYAGGENQRIVFPYDYNANGKSFEGYYAANARLFATYILGRADKPRWKVPDQLKAGLNKLRSSGDAARFLRIRGLFPTPLWPWSYSCGEIIWDQATWTHAQRAQATFITKHYNDLIASTLLFLLNTEHRPKPPETKKMFTDHFTTPGVERDIFCKADDLPTRFRTVDPELHFADEADVDKHEFSPEYVIYLCIENPISEPLFLLPVDEVVSRLDSTAKARLAEDRFQAFDSWDDSLRLKGKSYGKPMLRGHPLGPRMSYDANRTFLKYDDSDEDKTRGAAISALRKAIQASNPLRITLERGEALIVDNHRVLVRRAEPDPARHPPRSRKAIWRTRWIRVYAGYPLKKEKKLGPIQERSRMPSQANES